MRPTYTHKQLPFVATGRIVWGKTSKLTGPNDLQPASTTNRVAKYTAGVLSKTEGKQSTAAARSSISSKKPISASVCYVDRACSCTKYQVYVFERRTMVRTRSGDTALWPPWRCSCNRRGRCGVVLPVPAPAAVACSPCPSPDEIDHPVCATWGVRAPADGGDARRVMQQSGLMKDLIYR